jgi:hypothetical protein
VDWGPWGCLLSLDEKVSHPEAEVRKTTASLQGNSGGSLGPVTGWPPSGPMRETSVEKAQRDLVASRNILRANITLFHQGHLDVYRVVATELRKLFCDRPKALVERLFPKARLHPTRIYRAGEDLSGLVVQVPAELEFDGKGGVRVVRVFERRRDPVTVKEWLDQPVLRQASVRGNFSVGPGS